MRKTTFKLIGVFLLAMGVLMAIGCIAYTTRNIISGLDIFNSEATKAAQLELKTAQTKLATQKEITTQTLAELDIWREKEILAGRDVDKIYALARDKLLTSAAQALTRQGRMHTIMQAGLVALVYAVLGLATGLLGWIIYARQAVTA